MKRVINIANFNLTFGENEEPMLAYFDTIVYPAFTSGIKKEGSGGNSTKYFLTKVKLDTDIKNNYILTGLIVKETILEIKSQIKDENLVNTDYEYPTAPYSFFCIYLKNHRMYLIKNQNGSPDLRNFQSTVTYLLKEYVANQNIKINNEKNEYPIPDLDIIGIPHKISISKELEKVDKISKLTLKFFPLNGDTDYSEAFKNLSGIRSTLNSKTGKVDFNSPKNKDNVALLIADTNGTVKPVLKVTYAGGKREATITMDQLSEKVSIEIVGDRLDDTSVESIMRDMSNNETLNYMGGNHLKVFEKYKDKIKRIFKS